jgi:pyrroline-5-carboxylate reductase
LAVVELDATRRQELTERFPGVLVSSELVPASGAVLAVKPQHVVEACAAAAAAGADRILSIAAGIGLAALESGVPAATRVVRAMPNTPALVGAGAAAIAGGTAATEADLIWAESILGAVGLVVRVSESQLDAVTGVSGSGPAYVFLLAEALADAGVLAGLPRPLASQLAAQTILGAGELLVTGESAAELRAAVTSPGGTTAAALQVLESRAVRAAVIDAVQAAVRRSRELGA